MFTSKICLAIVLLSLHEANSYILLTANLDDVHSLAKQLASSPVANQLTDIIRRASSIFNQHKDRHDSGNKAQMRTDPELDEEKLQSNGGEETKKSQWRNPAEEDESKTKTALASELNAKMSDSSRESNDIRPKTHHIVRRNDPDLAELGRNASFYLKSIKKIFESI